MATINPSQDYDIIHTLELKSGTTACNIRLYRGSISEYSGTVYYRMGTSGAWTSKAVSGTATTITGINNTTIQVGHSWNKDGNNHMNASFYGEANLLSLDISQKDVLSGVMVGTHFMYCYAQGCSSLSSLAVPDTSNLSSVGTYFMYYYAQGCSSLLRLELPNNAKYFINNNVEWSVPSNRLGYLKGYTQTWQAKLDWGALTVEGKTLHTNYIRDTNNIISAPPVTEPEITQSAATNITSTSARLPYNLTDDGGDDTTVKVYWGTSDGGTTTGNWQNSYSLGVKNEGSGYYDLSSLSNKTKYYYRYYAENSAGGTWASSTLNFTTLAALPSVTTDSASSITSTSFSMSGNVIGIGGENVSERGFCYIQGTSGTPTTANSKVYDSGSYGTGSYSKSITGLSNKTSYRVRAYAINSAGTAYGSTITVSTLAALPTVTTGSASSIATTSFTMSGNITSIGGENVTQRGFCYLAGTAGTPTTSNSKVYDSGSFGTGTYSKSITGLSDNTSYRVRAYAVNSAGTGYGSTITVKTDRQPQTYNYTASVPMLSVPTSAKATKVSRTSISTITCIPYAAMGVFKIYYYTAVATIGTVATSIKKSITNITSSADIRLSSFALRQALVSRTSSAIVGLKPEALKARIKSFVGQSIVGCRAIALRVSTFNRAALAGVGAKASAIKVRIINRTASAVVGLKAKAELAIYDILDTIAVFNQTFYDAVMYDGGTPYAIYYYISSAVVGLKSTASRAVKISRTATAYVGTKASAVKTTVSSFISSAVVGLKPSTIKVAITNIMSTSAIGIKASAFRSTVNSYTSSAVVGLKATAIKARIKDFVAVSSVGLKSFAEKTRSFSVTATVAVEMIATAFTDTMKVYAYTALAYVGIKPTAVRQTFVSRVAQVTVELKPFATRFKDYTVIALSTVEAVPTSVRQFIKNATATVGINLKAFASRHARLNRVASIAVVLKPFAVRFREITFVAVSTVEAVPSAIVRMIYTCVAFVAVGLKSFVIATLTSLKRKIFTALRIRRPLDLELTFKRPFYLELESKGKDRLE